MLNAIGLLLVALTTSCCGILYAHSLRTRVRVIESVIMLIAHIRMQIDGFRTPLREIYQSYSDATLHETGIQDVLRLTGFSGALPRIRSYTGSDVSEALERFEGQLGKTSAQEQILFCLQTEQRLQEILTREKAALPARMRLCTTLGICCGIMLDIILI